MRWRWIDRFEEFHTGERATSVKVVSSAEDHLYESSPSFPVMPHSLILEGLAQTGGILLGESTGFARSVVLAKITSARFDGFAVPGDVLHYHARLVEVRAEGGMVECRVERNGSLMAEAEIFFGCIDDPSALGIDVPGASFTFDPESMKAWLKQAKGTYQSAESPLESKTDH